MRKKDRQHYKNTGRIFIISGGVMLLMAMVLIVWNSYRDLSAQMQAQDTLVHLKEEAQHSVNGTGRNEDSSQHALPDSDTESESAIIIDKNPYIGIISIPKLGKELPVLGELDYEKLDLAPCRYSGSAKNGDLIIAAHNFRSFFEQIDQLNSGDEIDFTDAAGKVYSYEVSYTEIIGGSETMRMKEGTDEWDLTLFTCNWSGYARVAVRAVRLPLQREY